MQITHNETHNRNNIVLRVLAILIIIIIYRLLFVCVSFHAGGDKNPSEYILYSID